MTPVYTYNEDTTKMLPCPTLSTKYTTTMYLLTYLYDSIPSNIAHRFDGMWLRSNCPSSRHSSTATSLKNTPQSFCCPVFHAVGLLIHPYRSPDAVPHEGRRSSEEKKLQSLSVRATLSMFAITNNQVLTRHWPLARM